MRNRCTFRCRRRPSSSSFRSEARNRRKKPPKKQKQKKTKTKNKHEHGDGRSDIYYLATPPPAPPPHAPLLAFPRYFGHDQIRLKQNNNNNKKKEDEKPFCDSLGQQVSIDFLRLDSPGCGCSLSFALSLSLPFDFCVLFNYPIILISINGGTHPRSAGFLLVAWRREGLEFRARHP